MESISSAPKMTEINVDNLPGIRCVNLDVILPTAEYLYIYYIYIHFWQRVNAISEDITVAEMIVKTIIFQCSRSYGTPTLVTRLNIAPNISIPDQSQRELNVALNNFT